MLGMAPISMESLRSQPSNPLTLSGNLQDMMRRCSSFGDLGMQLGLSSSDLGRTLGLSSGDLATQLAEIDSSDVFICLLYSCSSVASKYSAVAVPSLATMRAALAEPTCCAAAASRGRQLAGS